MHANSRFLLPAALGLLSLVGSAAGHANERTVPASTSNCEPSWLSTFGGEPGVGGGTLTGAAVYAMTVFDDGHGEALYVGGDFTSAGGVPAGYIAKWDGKSWSAVGGGMNSWVQALLVFDDGSGDAL